MFLQFFCPEPKSYGIRCYNNNSTWHWLGTNLDLYCCKGEMCNDINIDDNDYTQKILQSCQNMNKKRKEYSIEESEEYELIDCSLVS